MLLTLQNLSLENYIASCVFQFRCGNKTRNLEHFKKKFSRARFGKNPSRGQISLKKEKTKKVLNYLVIEVKIKSGKITFKEKVGEQRNRCLLFSDVTCQLITWYFFKKKAF